MFTSQIFLYGFQPEIDPDCSFAAGYHTGGNKKPDHDKIIVSNYKSLV